MAGFDTRVPQAARVYDYLQGGVVNFAVDREAVEQMTDVLPGGLDSLRRTVRANRTFLAKAVRFLAGELGIRQFLDIGTGVPNDDNVHAVAQAVAPDTRVVYVDNDPIVLAHAHVLLRSTDEGSTAFLEGDLRDPESILVEASRTLDFGQPIALMLVAILHLLSDRDDPYDMVTRLVDALPSGSYLAISHLTNEFQPGVVGDAATVLSKATGEVFVPRRAAEIARFFEGLEMVEPGLLQVDQWNRGEQGPPSEGVWVNNIYCGIARKS